jgi:hypothetical protein
MDPGGNRLARYQEAFMACASRIAPARRRLSLGAAESIVLDEHSARELPLVEGAARRMAEELLRHPLWPFLHPIRARREGWTWGWRTSTAQEEPAVTLEQLIARDARFMEEYEALARRLRGASEDEAREAVQRLLRETNQQLSAAEVDLFTLGAVDPGWAEKDPKRAERLRQQLASEAAAAEEDWPDTP